MFCPYCGKELPEKGKFCSYCGKYIGDSYLAQTAQTPQMEDTAKSALVNPKNLSIAISVLILLLFFFGNWFSVKFSVSKSVSYELGISSSDITDINNFIDNTLGKDRKVTSIGKAISKLKASPDWEYVDYLLGSSAKSTLNLLLWFSRLFYLLVALYIWYLYKLFTETSVERGNASSAVWGLRAAIVSIGLCVLFILMMLIVSFRVNSFLVEGLELSKGGLIHIRPALSAWFIPILAFVDYRQIRKRKAQQTV